MDKSTSGELVTARGFGLAVLRCRETQSGLHSPARRELPVHSWSGPVQDESRRLPATRAELRQTVLRHVPKFV